MKKRRNEENINNSDFELGNKGFPKRMSHSRSGAVHAGNYIFLVERSGSEVYVGMSLGWNLHFLNLSVSAQFSACFSPLFSSSSLSSGFWDSPCRWAKTLRGNAHEFMAVLNLKSPRPAIMHPSWELRLCRSGNLAYQLLRKTVKNEREKRLVRKINVLRISNLDLHISFMGLRQKMTRFLDDS